MINQIELHYFFSDDSHTLDAFVRNKCETEFLLIIKEVLETFELDINIETIVPSEGGLKEVWKFIERNSNGISAVSAIISPLIAIILYLLSQEPKQDVEYINLQKEHIKLLIEEKKLKINKIRNKDSNQYLTKKDTNEMIKVFTNNFKITKHRSLFYESISKVEKITKITTSTMYKNKVVDLVDTIEKDKFSKYIVLKNELPLEIIEDAEIEIISPILKQGNFKWKGILGDEQIDFYMKDKEFKQSSFNGNISFSSGFNIKCVLEVKRIINEIGEIKIKNYSVLTVISKLVVDNNKTTEEQTIQGKKYLKRKKELVQPNLFDLNLLKKR